MGAVSDEKDWAQSLEAHRKYLQRYAFFHLHDQALAEDAVQDTIIAALAQGNRFEGRSQLRTWLTAILKHKIVDLARKRAKGLPAGTLSLDDDSSAGSAFTPRGEWAEPAADWGLPEAALESQQFWRVYQECCQRMPERHAIVFSMREVMDLPSDEICKKLDITPSNLHVILFRARLSLRACMTKNWFGAAHG